MYWKIFIFVLSLGILASCGGIESQAKKLCNCQKEVKKMKKDDASKADIKAKKKECEEIGDAIDEKYGEDKEAMKKGEKAYDDCMDE